MANRATTAKTLATGSMLSAVAAGAALMSGSVLAEESLEGALKASTAKLNLRPRYENVTQESLSSDDTTHSDALTLKTRLTFTTGSYHGVSALLEFDDVTSLKDVDYFDGTNGKDGPAIVDPEGTEVNQAYLAYTGLEHTEFKWGRQRILLDNQRFVGGVGWRQNEQTYDAFSVSNSSISGLTAFYANVSNVNRIVGEAADAGDHTHETNLLNVGYKIHDFGTLTAYYYDIDNQDALAVANETMGLRFAGSTAVNDITLAYELEWADQEETGDNPVEYSADYTLVSIAGTLSGFTLGIAQETLGADDDAGVGFTTSLATLHKFQGWADRFLGTPSTGIKDLYVTFKAGLPMGLSFIAMYHDFESAEDVASGSDDFGSEIDMALTKKFDNGATLQLKYADFSGEEDAAHGTATSDVSKVWVMATYAI